MNVAVAALLTRGALAANGLRLLLTLACIALGVALAGAVHTIHTSALAQIDRSARTLAGAADLEVRGPRSGFDDAWFAVVARRPEVMVASPVVELEAPVAGTTGTLRLVGLDALRAMRLQPGFVADAATASALGAAALLDWRAVWLSPAAAAELGKKPGDSIAFASGSAEREFRVAGVLPAMNDAGAVAVLDIAAAQTQFERLGLLSRIDLRLRPGVDAERFRAELTPLLPAGVAVGATASLAARAESITRAYRVNLDALALVALATGAFLVFSTLALQAARRRQEFALLRALGVTRAGLAAVLALEGAVIGAIGAGLGTALGVGASRAVLRGVGSDLGAGFFSADAVVFAPHLGALAFIALLAVAMSVGGALWVARSVGRIPVAEALRDRAVDLPMASRQGGLFAAALVLAGVPLLFVPPIAGLPLGGYAAIAAWLAASVVAVGPLCRGLLARLGTPEATIPALALAQVRHLPGHVAASVAGIVVSAALCVAMAIMVFSFRVSLEEWLGGVVGADLYVRPAAGGDTGYFTLDEQRRIAALPEIAQSSPTRFDRLVVDGDDKPVSLVARPIDARTLAGFQAEPATMPVQSAERPVWISEAARDLHGWQRGDAITLPIAGRPTPLRVAGTIRDYARTWGAVLMPIEDYRSLTGDTRASDLQLRLAAGVDVPRAQAAIARALPEARGLVFEDAAELRQRSLEIFDRSFAVTYAMEAIAIVIALAGVTSSFAALAWSRRREFGVLRFLGFRRRDILRMLALEGALSGAVGSLIGLVAGVAISLVLVRVVNRQSFHWSIDLHWPVIPLVAFVMALLAMCAIGARVSGALAVRHEAVLAVKDDA